MDSIFGRRIRSPLVTFQVGPEKEDLVVHSLPLAELSPALDVLMNGSMVEAKTNVVDWTDVNKNSFIRLCEYAYLQDYTPPDYQQRANYIGVSTESYPSEEAEVIPEQPKNHEFWDGWQYWTPLQRKRKEREAVKKGIPPLNENYAVETQPEVYVDVVEESPEPEQEPELEIYMDRVPSVGKWTIYGRNLQNIFLNLEYAIPATRNRQFETTENTEPAQDFLPVFLGHAELYKLADKYGIEPLRQLALHKLHHTLKMFTIYEPDVPSIMKFVKYAYKDTPSRRGGEIDMLRKLATRYIVSILERIAAQDEFMELIAEGGDFVVDLWKTIWGEAQFKEFKERY